MGIGRPMQRRAPERQRHGITAGLRSSRWPTSSLGDGGRGRGPLRVEREAQYDYVPERDISAPVVASAQPFPLEPEFVEQVEGRLVVREHLGCELADAPATSPLNGRCDQPRADAAAAQSIEPTRCPVHARGYRPCNRTAS